MSSARANGLELVHTAQAKPAGIVVYVHGTGARDAQWTKAQSSMTKGLTQRGDLDVLRFEWSGENSHNARLEAGKALANALASLPANERTAEVPTCLVTHSHGGNVALYAMKPKPTHVKGIACLATPFLHFARIQMNVWPVLIYALLILMALALVPLLAREQIGTWLSDNTRTLWVLVGAGALLSLFVVWRLGLAGHRLPPIRFLKEWFRYDLKAMEARLQLPQLHEDELLIVRPIADEAAGILGGAQFVSWAGRAALRALNYVAVLAFVLSMLPKLGAWAEGWFWKSLTLISVAVAGTFGLIAFVGTAFANAFFGYDALAWCLRASSAAAESPPGRARVYQVALKDNYKHGAIYDSSVACEAVNKFVRERLGLAPAP